MRNYKGQAAVLLAVAATFLPAAALAQPKRLPLGNFDGWSISREAESCIAERQAGGETIAVGQTLDAAFAGVFIVSPKLAPHAGAGRNRLALRLDDKPVNGGNMDIRAADSGNGPRLLSAFTSAQLIPHFGKPTQVAASVDGAEVWRGQFRLGDRALDAFTECVLRGGQ